MSKDSQQVAMEDMGCEDEDQDEEEDDDDWCPADETRPVDLLEIKNALTREDGYRNDLPSKCVDWLAYQLYPSFATVKRTVTEEGLAHAILRATYKMYPNPLQAFAQYHHH